MVLGRMVYNFTSTARVAGIKAWRFTLYFVLLDIVSVSLLCMVVIGESSLVLERFWLSLLALRRLLAKIHRVIKS